MNTMVSSRLSNQENVVYQCTGGFHFSDISTLGTHTLYITNTGRLLAHDTGGIFGSEQVKELNAKTSKLKVTFFSHFIKLQNASPNGLRIDVSLSIMEFIDLYSAIPKECFSMEQTKEPPCYIRYDNEVSYTFCTVKLHPTLIELIDHTKTRFTIPFCRIDRIDLDSKWNMILHGIFDRPLNTIPKIHCFIPQLLTIKQIMDTSNQSPKIFDIVSRQADLYPVAITCNTPDRKENGTPLTLAHDQDKLSLVDENSMTVFWTFSFSKDPWFFNEQNNDVVVIQSECAYLFKPKRIDAIQLFRKKVKQAMFSDLQLSGVFINEPHKNINCSFLINQNQELRCLFTDMSLSPTVSLQSYTLFVESESLFLFTDHEISMIVMNPVLHDFLDDKGLLNPECTRFIGYMEDLTPFFVTQTDEAIRLSLSSDIHLSMIPKAGVIDISFVEIKEDAFSKVVIQCQSDQHKVEHVLYLPSEQVPQLIYSTYHSTKQALVHHVNPEQLYLSWARQVNDYAIYHYFGQLFAVYEGINEIRERLKNRDQRNKELINYLYYAIQMQKKRLDIVSIYLPGSLEKESRSMLNEIDFPLDDQPFRNWQRSMMGITNQIRGSLNEIESALSAVSSAIYPRADMEQYIQNTFEKRMGYAVGVSAIGVTTGTIAGLAFPPLLLAGVFMGFNSYFSHKENKEREQLRQAEESARLDFYMDKALSSFDHMMRALLPYYLSEMNRNMVHCFEELAAQYRPALSHPHVKAQLFDRISQYYTFKQLPIDSSVTLKRTNFIDEIQNTTLLADHYMTIFNQEVDYHVPKRLEAK